MEFGKCYLSEILKLKVDEVCGYAFNFVLVELDIFLFVELLSSYPEVF